MAYAMSMCILKQVLFADTFIRVWIKSESCILKQKNKLKSTNSWTKHLDSFHSEQSSLLSKTFKQCMTSW